MIPRWPERECLHQNVQFEFTLKLFTGEVVKRLPVTCSDCGFVIEGADERD